MTAHKNLQKNQNWRFIIKFTLIGIATTVLICYLLYKFLKSSIDVLDPNIVAAFITLIAAGFSVVWSIVFYKLTHYYIVSLRLITQKVNGKVYKITARVANKGGDRFLPRTAHVVILEGTWVDKKSSFPFTQEYLEGDKHCRLGNACHLDPHSFPEELKDSSTADLYSDVISLRYLSDSMTLYSKGEDFKESFLIEFPRKGIYKIIFVFSTTRNDCRCKCETVYVQ